MKDCVGGREFVFSLKSYLKASCFVGINIMYNKKLLQNLYLKIDLLKLFQNFGHNGWFPLILASLQKKVKN